MSPIPVCRPSAWIERCAAILCDGDAWLDPGRASDLATTLWDREAWRGEEPEQAARRHLATEAVLGAIRQRLGTGGPHG